MKWLLAGASGFLGTAMRVRLASEGEPVVRLVCREPATSTEFWWDPDSGELDTSAFDGVDVVVNLGGIPVAPLPWTQSRREQILASRVNTTSTVARALAAQAGSRPRTLIQASGIARYGTSSEIEPYIEDSPAAADYLAQVTTKWEAATEPAGNAGVRVVLLRTSPVMDSSGGQFALMKLAWSCGLGATLGDGSQRMPMISLRDYLAVVHWAASNEQASGPYNLTIPQPATNAEFTDALAAALHRPRFLLAPAPIIRTALGELAGQLVGDMYAIPKGLTDSGFVFSDPTVNDVIASALGRRAQH
ncbi:MAG TPA: TIGR01777 family oxidoreductase [Propionibacteriaceae bacterium]